MQTKPRESLPDTWSLYCHQVLCIASQSIISPPPPTKFSYDSSNDDLAPPKVYMKSTPLISTYTSTLLDTAYKASINELVLSDVQWSPPSDLNYNISSTTPLKPANCGVNIESIGARSRAQITRRMPKYLEDYQL